MQGWKWFPLRPHSSSWLESTHTLLNLWTVKGLCLCREKNDSEKESIERCCCRRSNSIEFHTRSLNFQRCSKSSGIGLWYRGRFLHLSCMISQLCWDWMRKWWYSLKKWPLEWLLSPKRPKKRANPKQTKRVRNSSDLKHGHSSPRHT